MECEVVGSNPPPLTLTLTLIPTHIFIPDRHGGGMQPTEMRLNDRSRLSVTLVDHPNWDKGITLSLLLTLPVLLPSLYFLLCVLVTYTSDHDHYQ